MQRSTSAKRTPIASSTIGGRSKFLRRIEAISSILGVTLDQFKRSIEPFVEGLEEQAKNGELEFEIEILQGDIPRFFDKELRDAGVTFGVLTEGNEEDEEIAASGDLPLLTEEEANDEWYRRFDQLLGAITYGLSATYFNPY